MARFSSAGLNILTFGIRLTWVSGRVCGNAMTADGIDVNPQDLRQYRTKIVRILRSQIFRQIVQKRRSRASARQGVFGRYDGKDASKMRAKSNKWSLCGVALISNQYMEEQ